MREALIKEIALQVVQQGLLSNWLFYAVILAVSLVSGVIGAYLSKYSGKRGEQAAIKADFKEILKQLQVTTKISKEVRSAVSHTDLVALEWKTIRRIKLEELVNSAMSVKDWSKNICCQNMAILLKTMREYSQIFRQTNLLRSVYYIF